MTVERALHLLAEVGNTNTKLILIVGSRGAGKSKFLRECSMKLGINHLNVSYELGRQLGFTSCSERSFLVGDMLRDMAEKYGRNIPLLLDNLELLFEPSLKISPLDLLKRLAHSRPILAVWPGLLQGENLTYADMTHPEYRNYSSDGITILKITNS